MLLCCILLVSGCASPLNRHKVTFHVITGTLPDSSEIYVTGNHFQLGVWTPNKAKLNRQEDGSWLRSFSFEDDFHLEYKITRGSWFSEAVDKNGIIYQNFKLDVKKDTTVTIYINNWRDKGNNRILLTSDSAHNASPTSISVWKYHPGDNPDWAKPEFNDSSWEIADPRMFPDKFPLSGWNGIGWFRSVLVVDSALWNKPLGMYFWQMGACEIFIDGKPAYVFGKVGTSRSDEVPYDDRNPQILTLKPRSEHLIAVRYSNHSYQYFTQLNIEAGFVMAVGDLHGWIIERVDNTRSTTINQMIFTVIPVAFAVFHLLLFIFYPSFKENLYYSLCMLCFGILVYCSYQMMHTTTAEELVLLWRIQFPIRFLTVIFGIMTYRTLLQMPITKPVIAFILIGIAMAVMGIFKPAMLNYIFFFAYFILASLEIIRGFFLKKEHAGKDAYIVGAGFLVLAFALVNDMLDYFNFPFFLRIPNPALFGMVALSIATLIYLSRKFARTYKDLEMQLIQVKELSERSLEQERRAKEEEIRLKIIEADNKRKTKELEDARALQLSMLPNTIQVPGNLDIAVKMLTAVEVGGDYYDFRADEDGKFIIALGDATGHGMKAGIMVATMKSLFHISEIDPSIPKYFNHCTRVMRQMHFDKMYMGLTLARIQDSSITISAAGMPPILFYRAATRQIETITIKGMPLGAHSDFPYTEQVFSLAPGDTLLFMSDGFSELFNEDREMLDLGRVSEYFLSAADKTPEEIVQDLCNAAECWRGNAPQADDMTFVVLQVK